MAPVEVPTPSIGLLPEGTSSTNTPGAKYSGIVFPYSLDVEV
jgi:hypothetical protein